MDRRHVLLGLAGAAPLLMARTAAFGQTAPGGVAPLDAAAYAAQTLQVGTLAKTTSQVALSISKNPFIRRFAVSEIAEQTAVSQSLTSDFNPPPAALTAAQQQIIAALQALRGPAFDEAFVKAQLQGPEQLLAFQQEFLAGDTDPAADFVHVALIATAFIQTHLALLQGLMYIAPL